MIKEYRKITTIEAEQFDASDAMIKKYGIVRPRLDRDTPTARGFSDAFGYQIPTKEGLMLLSKGDWIATGVFGEHWVIKEAVFDMTYESAEGEK